MLLDLRYKSTWTGMSERGDIIDRANDKAQEMLDASIEEARHRAGLIEAGTQGDCDYCGEWSGRLVGGVCAPCRDKYNLP